ncbi:EamA family transporter [Poriferisphaera sp. WC338]|uniref:EamA family transporter n=1 Tax=Poriferisphaera sp. WC338 TaxID=3425129 RepID=UPI003D819F1C
MNFLPIFLVSLLAAVGNTLYVAGQKQAASVNNPIATNFFTLLVATACTGLAYPFFTRPETLPLIKQNANWILLSGFGLFIVYIGFNIMYTKFGPQIYPVYAVLSIVLVAFVLAVLIFHEPFNLYHAASIFFAALTVIFFAIAHAQAGKN